MAQSDFEVIVVGGGIQGAGCAQAFAAAGYTTCLLEQNTWGSGTSSRSSKLIHGGLRYLETYQFGLVRKSLLERRLLVQLAPSLVKPLPFIIPIYQGSRHQKWKIFAGLSLYSLLGGRDRLARFNAIPRASWQELAGIKTQGLKGVYTYWDTQTDDLQLTQAVVRSAILHGAKAREGTKVNSARREVNRYLVGCESAKKNYELSCSVLVNAAGPWAPGLQRMIEGAPPPPPTELVQGAHIELDKPLAEAVFYVESPRDRRAVFIMPWHQHTLVGTTETTFSGNPAEVSPTQQEVDYLLETLAHYFPDFSAKLINRFAGLRVLPRGTPGFSSRPRDTLVTYHRQDHSLLIALFGGKLTTYRATAQKILEEVRRHLGARPNSRTTATIPLSLTTLPLEETK